MGGFFTVFGIVYAIIVGFLLMEVLRRFHALSSTIQSELNIVEDIRDFLAYIDENRETKREIGNSLLRYINSVVEREWLQMEHASETIDSDTSPELYQVMDAVHKISVTNESDSVVLKASIDKIADLTTCRTDRLELSTQRLAPALRFLIVFMSVVLVISFALLNVGSIWIHGLMVFSVVTATHLLYMVISDLDRPFIGFWNIRITPFKRVAQRIEVLLEKQG